ncbi:FecCD family ABC transporter permease [Actinobacillus minor]|uniref:FecCD family ABC transporter permease n=1 Tax=Actinobacillus minor TaxID=51047 RepID=UPI0023F163C9|nr:iron ABC transporter permease [Actinobacillus minor]MDD6911084.1 iron ABC transporter permease [Actinobacillus minor]MDY4713260.1 iron ABC transporter permease [Actinobacillus minor]
MKNSFSLILLLVLICCAVLSLSLGRFYIAPSDVMATLFNIGGSEIQHNIIFNLRLPRVIAAILVGAALAASGAVYQGVFRNPLVSPDLLGVSSGACVGASFAILCGRGILATQTTAFIGGIIAVMITMTIPKLMQRDANILLILSGIIVSGFMMACLGLLKYLADPETQLADIVYWQLGSLTKTDYHNLRLLSPIILVTLLLLFAMRWRINVLSLGEREATLVGVNVKFERNVMVVNATLLTASAVCLSGTIGWIGLIIPHLSRLMIGDNNVKTLPISMLLGAIFLLVVDTVARNLYAQEIPLGIITGFLGAPCFAWALIKQKRVS